MKLLHIQFILLLLLFSFGEVIRITLIPNATVKLLDVGVLFLLLLSVTQIIELKKIATVTNDPLWKPILLFLGVAGVSLFVNSVSLNAQQFTVALSYLLRWGMYAAVYFIVRSFDTSFRHRIQYLLLIPGVLLVANGLLQYFFYNDLRNLYYLGWDDHMHRLFTTFLDPNFAGAFFVLFFLYLLGLFYQTKEKTRLGIGILIGLTGLVIFLTYSRSALLMLAVGVFVFLVIQRKLRWFLLLLLLVGIFMSVLYATGQYKVENTNLFRVASSEARLETASIAWQLFQKNPVFGVGFNAYRYAQVQAGFRTPKGAATSHADAGSDTSLLFVLATTGFVGFIAYVFIWVTVTRYIWDNIRKRDMYTTVLVASIAGLFVNSLFINSLFFPSIMLWMWILLALRDYK